MNRKRLIEFGHRPRGSRHPRPLPVGNFVRKAVVVEWGVGGNNLSASCHHVFMRDHGKGCGTGVGKERGMILPQNLWALKRKQSLNLRRDFLATGNDLHVG